MQKKFSILYLVLFFISSPGLFASDIQLLTPQNGAIGVVTNPLLTWTPVNISGETIYTVMIATDTGFINTTSYITSGTSLQLGGLVFATRYYWKVTAVTDDTLFTHSDTWQFKTGTTWHNIANFAQGQIVWDIIECNPYLIAGTWGGGIYRASDFPEYKQWIRIDNGINAAFIWSLACDDSGVVFAGTERGIFKSEDFGDTWNLLSLVVGDSLIPPDVRSVIYNHHNDLIVAATWGYGVFYSNDGGQNWFSANNGLGSLAVQALTFAAGYHYVFAGTADNGIYRIEAQGLGSDHWYKTNMNYNYIWSLASDSDSSGNYVFSGTYGAGFYRSFDHGMIWTQNNTGLTSNYIYALYNYDFELYAGVWPGGVFKSANKGLTWEDLGLSGYAGGSVSPSSILRTKQGELVVGTNNGKIYKTGLPSGTTNVDNNNSVKPESFVLNQNYPNPFNPSTTISWQTDHSGWVTLKVYDVLGNEVANLVNEFRPAGNYSVSFNAANLPSGVYVYKLQNGNSFSVRKMVLMK